MKKRSKYNKNKPFIEYLYGTGGNIKLSNESIDLVKLKNSFIKSLGR